jgi:hypothetical protein
MALQFNAHQLMRIRAFHLTLADVSGNQTDS